MLLDVLELMKAVDKEHYEGLEKLVAPSDGLPSSAEQAGTGAKHAALEVA